MADFNSIEDYFEALQNGDGLIGEEIDSEGCEKCGKAFKAIVNKDRTFVCPHCGEEYNVE
ncbi:hypothetical protein FDA33_01010 [Clostridium botulinum]|nr:hypothetical protein [Clostridium botulinum]NFH88810.1 hypothetical protein [Clostridium botulinum]NFI16764.1 hypothetical protein [Clostridium botulinum]NFI49640.1 hypothetical protein [Clostridium botulinum]NFI58570.1 hypothetical protein [Clostridium botulinum]